LRRKTGDFRGVPEEGSDLIYKRDKRKTVAEKEEESGKVGNLSDGTPLLTKEIRVEEKGLERGWGKPWTNQKSR